MKRIDRSPDEISVLLEPEIEKTIREIKKINPEQLEKYERVLKNVILNREKLDIFSKHVLPMAEFFYDMLNEMSLSDFSPFVSQYCKGLENELLKKVFVEFTFYLNEKYEKIDDLVEKDYNNRKGKTNKFAKMIKKFHKVKNSVDIQYTLGDMMFVLSLMNSDKILKDSPLLQEFKKFIEQKNPGLLNEYFLKSLEEIKEYRNKAAHPHMLDQEIAKKCKKQVPEEINDILDDVE